MKAKKFWGLLLAVTCMTTVVTGCDTQKESSDAPKVNPMDLVQVFEEDEVSPRKLFEGSEEVLKYAKSISVSGQYKYSDSLSVGDSLIGGSTHKTIVAEGPLDYKCYRDEDGNSSSVLSGGITYDESFTSKMLKNVDSKVHKEAKYIYYKTFDTTYVKDNFTYYGDGDICGYIDVEKILLPNISSLSVSSMEMKNGVYIVKVSGSPSPIVSAIDQKIEGRRLLSSVYYEFDCKTHELVYVELYGGDYDVKKSNDIVISSESKTFSIKLSIDDVSYKAAELPEMPQTISRNGFINDLILNDLEFNIKKECENPFDIENEFYCVADNIWLDVFQMPTQDRNTIGELKTAIDTAAASYDMKVDGCEYAFLGGEDGSSDYDGVLLKYSISGQDNLEGSIIVPFAGGRDGVKVGHTIVLDNKDYGEFKTSGWMNFIHENSPDCQYLTHFEFDTNGILDQKYKETKESKISYLSIQRDLSFFPESDRESLQKMAIDGEVSAFYGISCYEVKEKEDGNLHNNTYYVIDADIDRAVINEINEMYPLEIVPYYSMKSKLESVDYIKEEKSVKWVQILDE